MKSWTRALNTSAGFPSLLWNQRNPNPLARFFAGVYQIPIPLIRCPCPCPLDALWLVAPNCIQMKFSVYRFASSVVLSFLFFSSHYPPCDMKLHQWRGELTCLTLSIPHRLSWSKETNARLKTHSLPVRKMLSTKWERPNLQWAHRRPVSVHPCSACKCEEKELAVKHTGVQSQVIIIQSSLPRLRQLGNLDFELEVMQCWNHCTLYLEVAFFFESGTDCKAILLIA